MELLFMSMPQIFVEQLFFTWGCEQFYMTSCQLNIKTHYYLLDFRSMYFACQELPYGKKKLNIVH